MFDLLQKPFFPLHQAVLTMTIIISLQPLPYQSTLVGATLCPYCEYCQHDAASNSMQSQPRKCICMDPSNNESTKVLNSSDVRFIDVTVRTTCISLTTVNQRHGQMRNMYLGNMYKVVDQCSDHSLCKDFVESAPWGSIYPVYSSTTRRIYLNERCAHCNGDFNVTKWGIEAHCLVPLLLHASVNSGLNLAFDGGVEHDGACLLRFVPPTSDDLTASHCLGLVDLSCTESDTIETMYDQLCTMVSYAYSYDGYDESNYTLCYHCPMLEEASKDVCNIHGDSRTSIAPISFLIGSDTISSLEKDTRKQSQRTQSTECDINEVAEQKTGLCRPLRCPEGQVQTGDSCVYISTEWTAGPFLTYLKLKPVTDQDRLTRGEVGKLFSYKGIFFRDNLKAWKRKLYYYLPMNGTHIRYFVIKLEHEKHFFKPNDFFEKFRNSLAEIWTLTLPGKKLNHKASIHKYFVFMACDMTLGTMFTSGSNFVPHNHIPRLNCDYSENNEFLTRVRDESAKYSREVIALTMFFLCKQVDLKPTEYVEYFDDPENIYFNVTERYLTNTEFRKHANKDGDVVVSVCASTFGDTFWKNKVSGNALSVNRRNMPCVLVLLYTMKIVTVLFQI